MVIINKSYHHSLLFLLVAILSLKAVSSFTRRDFPDDFIFGAGSASYQYEGAAYEDGKGPSIWDTMTKQHPEKVSDHSNGNVAEDFYHRYKDDVKLMKDMGLDSFRFSISWSRLLPKGKLSGGVNQRGVKFYKDLINELLANGIKPFVTIFHYDLPQALEDEYKGVLHPKFVDDFRDYADLCFKEFGDKVKYWVTINEPNGIAMNAYSFGINAPNRCSSYMGNCTAGNSGTEPYIATHHMLLAHAAAVKLYRQKYQSSQKGQISITVVTHWYIPYDMSSPADQKAANRFLDFYLGWYLDPIVFGDYPKSMKSIVGKRLPKFTKEQSQMIKGSYDYLAINYYTSYYATDDFKSVSNSNFSYTGDMHASSSAKKNGVYLGKPTALDWLYIYPKGITGLMLYVKKKYNNLPVIITENGMADDSSLPMKQSLNDTERTYYHSSHLSYLLEAIKMGANIKGYYAWSFLDDFEWSVGYTLRFGLHYVDYKNGLKRYQKQSALWFKKFLTKY